MTSLPPLPSVPPVPPLSALPESRRHQSAAHTIALVGVLAAIASAVRITTVGIAGVEAVFIVIIIGARVLGPRLGMLLGVATIMVSSTITGGFGPWTLFQILGLGLIGLGAGFLPHRIAKKPIRGWRELALLAAYGILAAYFFGAFMNLWFWPVMVGPDTSLSFSPTATLSENATRFAVFTFVTSTSTWDTVRAVTTAVGIALVGQFMLRALRRRAGH